MNKKVFFNLLASLLMTALLNASFEAPSKIPFFDLFQSFSQRNNFLVNNIIKILDSRDKNTTWETGAHGYPDEVEVDFDFYHADDRKNGADNWVEKFTFSEVKLGEKTDIKTFEELTERIKENVRSFLSIYNITVNENLVLKENGRVILDFSCPQEGHTLVRTRPCHTLKEIRKVGNSEYQVLTLSVRYEPLSKEARDTWLRTFDKIRIKPEKN
jgi:hypothetical protein